jgi:hypothetical protein
MRGLRIAAVMLLAASTAACGVLTPVSMDPESAPSPVTSALPLPAATSFEEYAVAFCSAFEALVRAVGNPDSGEGSVLSKALDDAVVARDGAEADRLAVEIALTLEAGRREADRARGWAPAAPMMAELDRVLVAFESMSAAKAAVARGEPGAVDPQVALEQAGGLEAWSAMLAAWSAMEDSRPAGVGPCAAVPFVSP